MDGTYRGFEDFCVLNGRRTDEKYRGSYETSVMKRFGQFANSTHVGEDTEKLFRMFTIVGVVFLVVVQREPTPD
jgi:serine/threonine-protein kinase HipA